MIKVHTLYHKDGDNLLIVRVPWWFDIYHKLIVERACPGCGVSGLISRFDWKPASWVYSLWTDLIKFADKFEKEVYKVSIADGCELSVALWGTEDTMCIKDDCKFHDTGGD